ncbi:hypothetical protein KQ940_13210 [Marinobacterium sp. D7]|uniref:hypothetical protein n=1 Tax=Marinobacterium ramblicola TaxID=2849041 RepID=UPI001C2D3EC7|nr:hypothetical protein [Marinobacterium ramblicola]MBV1789010.1 hypothetical protein [Marinobacterium ramblicola]
MSQIIDQVRVNANGVEDLRGRLFVSQDDATITDLSGVKILHVGVDTVRQLYRGTLNAEALRQIEAAGGIVSLFGHKWHAGRVGRDSGYQFKLQNADYGLICLIKNFNCKADAEGPHLKIEVSPHLILSTSPAQLQAVMDGIAGQILDGVTPNQCAVHIAVDVQGWNPSSDLVSKMQCRSRVQRDFSGVERIEFDERAAVYGRGKSFMWGAANGHQFAIYNKADQAKATDKLDFWRGVWAQRDNPFDDADPSNYDPDMPVWRVEHRYHHSIVEQFAQGSVNVSTGEVMDFHTYEALSKHLTALWRYGCTAYKLLGSKSTYAPFWTLLRQDIDVIPHASVTPDEEIELKRRYKTASGFSGKNVELFMGNFISLLAREGVGAKKAFESLKRWDCWLVIREHFENRGQSERDIYNWIRDKLEERTVRWGRAV